MARRLRPELRRLRSEFGFELILCSWLYPDGCAMVELGRGLAVPVVLVSQGTDCHQYLKHPRRRRLIVGACNRARGVVTRSAELGRLLGAAGVAAGQLHTIYNGVDTSVFKPRPQADARAAVGYRGARSLLLFVGNLLPIKDPLFLLRAYGRLLATAADGGPDLVMVGKGSMRAEIEAELARLDIRPRVTLTGPLSAREVALWMSAADLLCMSSVNEGLPNVVLEAMASGLPIVSTDVGGIGELVDGHQSGLLVPAGDMDAYVAALQEQLGHDNAAPTTVGRDLSWAASAGRYAEILNSVK
jgi:glycosyltransferase involved in cell wall biosynthesis